MDYEIIPKQEVIPSFAPDEVAVKYIESYSLGRIYGEEEITSSLISEILKKVLIGINICLYLDPNGECNWLEVVSDGEWLSLSCCFEVEDNRAISFDNYYSYNSDFADTIEQAMKMDFSDESIYTPVKSGGQSPIPKVQAITDMEPGIKAVEYFIHTGVCYPGIGWIHQI